MQQNSLIYTESISTLYCRSVYQPAPQKADDSVVKVNFPIFLAQFHFIANAFVNLISSIAVLPSVGLFKKHLQNMNFAECTVLEIFVGNCRPEGLREESKPNLKRLFKSSFRVKKVIQTKSIAALHSGGLQRARTHAEYTFCRVPGS